MVFDLYIYSIQKDFMRNHFKYHVQANKQNENSNSKIHFWNLLGGGREGLISLDRLCIWNSIIIIIIIIMRGYLRHQCCESAWKDKHFEIDFFFWTFEWPFNERKLFFKFCTEFFIKLYSIAIMKKINILKRFYRFQLQIIDVLRC